MEQQQQQEEQGQSRGRQQQDNSKKYDNDDHNNDDNNNNINNKKPQQKSNHRLQQMEDYQPGDHLKEHKYSSFCRSSKRCEKSEAPHINKDSSSLSVLMMFFIEIFIC